MDDKEKTLSNYLLADFNATKAEIARRSNLQRAVTASMLAFYAWVFQYSLSNEIILSLVVVIWVISFLGSTFYIRESAEINRLGLMIKEKIATPIGDILGYPPEKVIPSEAREEKSDQENWKHMISVIFNVFLYLVFPLYFTGRYMC